MKKGICIHFNGTANKCCDAGVVYVEVASPVTEEQRRWHDENYSKQPVENVALFERLPCFSRLGLTGLCHKFQEPTAAELIEHEREILLYLSNTTKARNAIVDHCKTNNLPRSTAGSIPCPVCQMGTLHFSRAGNNGHIHAKCTTEKCVYWME